MLLLHILYPMNNPNTACLALAEEATDGKGGTLLRFSIAKIAFLWKGLKFTRGQLQGPPSSPTSTTYI